MINGMEGSTNASVTNSSTHTYAQPEPIIDDQLREALDLVLSLAIIIFAFLGVVTNAINMRVFIFQGFSDSNTVGLFVLAVTDFAGCLFQIHTPFCVLVPYFTLRITYFSCVAWTTVTGHILHMLMSRITCWITVYIAVERCLCVLLPFKVKSLFSPKTTAISATVIYLVAMGSYIPYFVYTRVGTIFHRGLNTTITILKQGPRGTIVSYYIGFAFNNVLSNAAVIIVAIATGLMIYKLKESRKWRQNASKATDDSAQRPPDNNIKGKREVEVLKMVTMVTGLFIICTTMGHIPGMTAALIPNTSATGINRNLFFVVYAFKIIFDLVNSSLNYFFYVRISSKYKAAFEGVFGTTRIRKVTES